MKRFALALLAAVALGLVSAPAAQADEWEPWNITDPGSVCVRPDFPVLGSGWKVQKAVANWNSVQSSIHFVMGYNEACNDIVVHRVNVGDETCGGASFDRLWSEVYSQDGVIYFAGADIFLNDVCSTAKTTRKWVIAHELGHAIGLMHGPGDDSVMSPTYLARTYKGVPGPTDVAHVQALYGPDHIQ